MLTKCFFAAAIMLASPAFASAQDIIWSFSPTEVITTYNLDFDSATGSVYIFSDGLFSFDAIDLNFTTSYSDVIRFTGGEAFNPEYYTLGGTKFDSTEITVAAAGSSGRLFSVSVINYGVNPALLPLFDPDFVPGIGPNGAVLLARVDFDMVGFGEANLEFALGDLGALEHPNIILNPSFGSATLVAYTKLGYCLGDVNLSGTAENNFADGVDFFDIAPFIAVLASGEDVATADCNLDGVVDFLDIPPFIEILTGS